MALSRKYLQGMGLNEEQINAIVEANEETITGLKAEIEKHQKASESSEKSLAKVQKELDEMKKEAEEGASKNPYKVKYEAIKAEFDKFKADTEAKESRAKKEEAYKAILKDANIPEKHFAKIIKYSDIDGLEFDDKGELSNKSELLKSIKEEWGDHIEQTGTKGANVQNPPANGGKSKMTKEEIMQIKDRAERQKAMLENKELFI